MNSEPIISICIPTKNQPQKFEALLKSLLVEDFHRIEVVVIDDSADIRTGLLAQEYGERLPIRYYKGEKLGFDMAIISLVERANGKYIWWIGDDLIEVGAVNKIVRILEQYPDISFLWLNSRNIKDVNDVAFNLGPNRFIKDYNEPLRIDIGMLCFASTTILKRKKIVSAIESSKKYSGLSIISLYFVLFVLTQDGQFYYVSHPYILSESKPSGEVRWYDQFQVFCINIFNVVSVFKNKFTNASVRFGLRKNLRQAIKAVLVERGMGLRTGFASDKPKIIPMLKSYWTYWEAWMAVPFMLLPRPLLMVLYWLFKRIKRVIVVARKPS